jgi:hypothetical protein
MQSRKRPRGDDDVPAVTPAPSDRVNREQRSVFSVAANVFSMMFVLQSNQPLILALLYPPAKSRPEYPIDNMTSKVVLRALDMPPDQHLNYIDLLKYTTSGTNSEVDQRGLHRMIQNNPAHAIDWGQRILRCSEDTVNTVIYVGGKTANLAWKQVVEHERLVGQVISGDPNGPHAIYYPDHNGIIAVVGGVHPSAHLMAGGEARMTERFDDAMMMTRSLLAMSPSDRSVPETVHSAISSTYNDRQRLEDDRRNQLSELDSSANWSLLTLTHNVTWKNVQNLIATFSLAFLLMFMNLDSGIAFLSATVDAGTVLQLFATKCKITSVAQWRKIWCGSVASALASPERRAGFFAAIEKFSTKCKITTAVQWGKVMCDSVASALASPERRAGFFAALEKFSTK